MNKSENHAIFTEKTLLFRYSSWLRARSSWIKTHSMALIPLAKSAALYGLFSTGTWMKMVRKLSMLRDV